MKKRYTLFLISPLLLLLTMGSAIAQEATNKISSASNSFAFSGSLDTLIALGLIPLIPGMILMMSSFTRIVIVLSLTRQALGLQTTPPNQVIVGLAIAISAVAMAPTIKKIDEVAWTPWKKDEITLFQATQNSITPLKEFMQKNTRDSALEVFVKNKEDENSLPVIMASFVLSELRTGLEIGLLILVPFLLVDLIVASILMSLGMMMLSPAMVSLPIKILIFVLADGWTLIGGSLAGSFT